MNLAQLEVLVAIVENSSLTEAAEAVGLTQSAVSYSLSKLEAELGVRLLERGRQGITLTRIGEEVVHHARNILGQIEVIRQKSAQERGLTVGKVRFGCVPSVPPRLLTGILRDFQQRYPDIDTILFEGTPRELVDWLENGIIDVGTATRTEGYALVKSFVQAEVVVLLPKHHLLASRSALSLEDIAHETLISPKIDYGSLTMLLGYPQSSFPRSRHEVSTTETIFAMVRENMGVALVLKMQVAPELEGVMTLPLNPPLLVQIYLVSNIHSPAVKVFMESASVWAKTHGFAENYS